MEPLTLTFQDDAEAALGGIAMILVMFVYLALLVFWVMMLMNAAKTKKWGWFVAMLVFGLLAVVYRFAAYTSSQELVERQRRERERRKSRERAKDERIHELEQRVDELEGGDGA